jgi:riboflavin kinase/FMN adenylyltransferase
VHRWYGLDEVPEDWGACVVTIGVFDGVHRGHQRIVARAVELAETGAASLRAQGADGGRLPVVVVTFDPHPDEVVRPGSHPPFLSTARRRAELLAGLGADAVCMLPFTYEFSQLGPDEFVRTVLVDRLHAAAVVVGENFRFGHRAAGDVPLLAKLGEKYDYSTEGVPLLVVNGVTISSTYIRERLTGGEVKLAAAALGRPHRVEGVVVRGHMRGRPLGFPTANLECPPHTAIPADGIYAGWLLSLTADGQEDGRWPAAISVGPRTGRHDRPLCSCPGHLGGGAMDGTGRHGPLRPGSRPDRLFRRRCRSRLGEHIRRDRRPSDQARGCRRRGGRRRAAHQPGPDRVAAGRPGRRSPFPRP